MTKREGVSIAKLENGRLVVYDICDKNKEELEAFVPNLILEYLGRGTIYSINGKVQHGEDLRHFWTIKGRRANG